MKNPNHIVIYRDSKVSRPKYYGPFVSMSIAWAFHDQLPEPLEGGAKAVKSVSPYDHNEAELAAMAITRERDANHPVNLAMFKPQRPMTFQARKTG